MKLTILIKPGWVDVYESLQGSACKVHLTCIRVAESFSIRIGPYAYHEHVPHNSAAHMPGVHECDSTEHVFLNYIRSIPEFFPNSLRYPFIKCHRPSLSSKNPRGSIRVRTSGMGQ
jgi:hypothetical protein